MVEATSALGGVCLITADHGNAEIMLEEDGVSPHTAHTTSPVPLVVTAQGARLRAGGGLADLHFAYAGEPAADWGPVYYRLQDERLLVEYDNTQNDGNHVHSIWRDFKGDFGRDLLREHLKVAHN